MKVGSIVECVNDCFNSSDNRICREEYGYRFPRKGKSYTVREIRDRGILLEEIINPKALVKNMGWMEAGWRYERFVELLPPMEIQDALDSCEPVFIEKNQSPNPEDIKK